MHSMLYRKDKTTPKGKFVEITELHQEEFIHMEFAFYSVT